MPYTTGYLIVYEQGVLWTDNFPRALRLSRLFSYDLYDIKTKTYIEVSDYYD